MAMLSVLPKIRSSNSARLQTLIFPLKVASQQAREVALQRDLPTAGRPVTRNQRVVGSSPTARTVGFRAQASQKMGPAPLLLLRTDANLGLTS